MKPLIIIAPFMKVDGMALWPFILLRKATFKNDAVFIRHEMIHLRQQLEMLVLPFYLVYLLNYLFNLVRLKNHNLAYLDIIFEKEANANEADREYLSKRPFWAWLKYGGRI